MRDQWDRGVCKAIAEMMKNASPGITPRGYPEFSEDPMSDDEPEQEPRPKLNDKRWILKHVLVPVLLACLPIYGAWVQGRSSAQDEGEQVCRLERQTNMVIIRALMEQLAAHADGPRTFWPPGWTPPDASEDPPPAVAPAPVPELELSEALHDLPANRAIDLEPVQAQQHIGQIIREYEELEGILPEKIRGEVRARVAEGVKR